MQRPAHTNVPGGVLGGIFLSNLAALAFELVLTRIFSVTLWYHLAFMVVTVAMFGVGAGGLIVYFLARRISRRNVPRLLADLECIKAMLCALFIVVYLSIPFIPGQIIQPSLRSLPVVALIFMLAALPFLLSGMVNSVAFFSYSRSIGRLYFADLSGAAAGMLAAVAGLYLTRAPSLVLAVAAVGSVAALVFTFRGRGISGSRLRAGASLAFLLLFLFYNLGTNAVRVRFTKTYVERKIYHEKWSPIARITVIRYPLLVWGLGSRYPGKLPEDNFLIEQDGAAGTPIIPAGESGSVEWLDWDVTGLAYPALRPDSAVIIGSGGGKDILAAARFGVKNITAVEINPDMVETVQEVFAATSGRPYSLPGVRTRIAEGRHFLLRSSERFGLVQLSMVDSWAATSAGAFIMSENHLYTREAFDTYMEHLDDGGAISLSRFFVGFLPAESIRAFSLAADVLRRRGASDPGAHMFLATGGNIGTLIVKKTPLTQEEENRALGEAAARGYRVVFAPSKRGKQGSLFSALSSGVEPVDLYGRSPIDITPPIDDRPFFFFVLKPSWWLVKQRDKSKMDPGLGLPQNIGAAMLVRNIFVIASIFALLIMLIPVVFGRRRKTVSAAGPPARWLLYFAGIGAGFVFLEIPLIQKFILPLGHPVRATAAVLGILLLSSGLGSWFWGSRRLEDACRWVGRVAAAAGGFAIVYYFILGPAAGAMLALSAPMRYGAAALLVAPAGFFMGGAFPMAVRLVGERSGSSIPWLWAINGAFSVQASVLAMMLSIAAGFKLCFIAAAAAYGAAALAGFVFLPSAEKPKPTTNKSPG
ncbi:MAG: hypothetical protein ABIJ56_04815 [Pseudomonadota bacterium]